MSDYIPYFTTIWLRCGACEHDWDDWQPQQCPIDTWVAHVKNYRCPKCGNRKKVLLRMTPIEDKGFE